jgi:hypothetical protein
MGGFGKIQERQKPNLAGTHVNSEKNTKSKAKSALECRAGLWQTS